MDSLDRYLVNLKKDFLEKKIDSMTYMKNMYNFNKLLFRFSENLKGSDISKIEIDKDNVVFSLHEDNIKIIADGPCSPVCEVLSLGKYEPEDSCFVYKLIKDGDIIFDIGANIGLYSIYFSKKFPKSGIYSFEPVSITYEYLEKNINLNKAENVKLFNYGVSDKQEDVYFEYSRDYSSVASIHNLIDHNMNTKINCSLKSLDYIERSLKLSSLDFIKIDVEGCELMAIKGGKETFAKFLPIIFIELCFFSSVKFGYVPDDVLKELNDLGYDCFSSDGTALSLVSHIDENTDKYNYFFLHREKHCDLIEKYLKS
jgi:FkbM family methyltransferase